MNKNGPAKEDQRCVQLNEMAKRGEVNGHMKSNRLCSRERTQIKIE